MLRGTVFVATSVYSMARQKHRNAEKEGTLEEHKLSKKRRKSSDSEGGGGKMYLMAGLVSLVAVGYFVYQGYLETRVNTALDAAKVVKESGLDVPERFWGSYRPGVYFGMKSRSAKDVVTGLMWFLPRHVNQGSLGLRHWCEQGDNLKQFGWNKHDGREFGVQNIVDRGVKIETSFVKVVAGSNGGDWSNRVVVEGVKGTEVSLLYYAALEEGADASLQPKYDEQGQLSSVEGRSATLGSWRLWWEPSDASTVTDRFHIATQTVGLHTITDTVIRSFRLFNGRTIGLESSLEKKGKQPNLVVMQITGTVPFTLDLMFESGSNVDREGSLVGKRYTKLIKEKEDMFDLRFEKTFHLAEKGYNESAVRFAQSAMSNMVGGIGYFYGSSVVKSRYNSLPVPYWEAPLYTGVPSRSFFPRGFLWDEGFHNLLISRWDRDISADILAHWMDLMNSEGWIPREQILGKEARAKVPDEFVVQHNRNANPPTLLLTLHSIVKDISGEMTDWWRDYLKRMWPRLSTWYTWFNTTQLGDIRGAYRWRGRNASALRELNPKTLTSGLDDYPRASHPTVDERHVDLRCWMALASQLMGDIGKLLGRRDSKKYVDTATFLSNNNHLDSMHWSVSHQAYMDWGFHTDDVTLTRQKPPPNVHPSQVSIEKTRQVNSDPQLGFVNAHGYISLFPFLLQLLSPESDKLGIILNSLTNPDLLFTPYGLRSLSKNSPMYMKKNTEHDAPYWRGPIWININFLAIRSLHHYSKVEGPHQALAREVYTVLREAVVGNVMKQYYRTGYVWEQYNDVTGDGQGCKPFTGWSALTVLIMGETY